MIQCDGQIEMTDYLKSKIKSGRIKDLTAWINSQGKAQYTQIGELVRETMSYDIGIIRLIAKQLKAGVKE